jgi:hypothetical protein
MCIDVCISVLYIFHFDWMAAWISEGTTNSGAFQNDMKLDSPQSVEMVIGITAWKERQGGTL